MKSEGQSEEIKIKFSTKEKLRAYARFISIIWQYSPGLAIFRLFLLLLGAFLQPLEVYFFSLFIAAIASGETTKAIQLLIVVIISYGLRYLVNELTYSKADDWFLRVAMAATQQKIWESVAHLPPNALNKTELRRSLDYVREDLWRLNRLAGNSEWFLRSVLKFIAAIGLAITAPWWISILVLIDSLLQAANLRYEAKREVWNSVWNSLDGRRIEYTRYVFLEMKHFLQLRLLGGEMMFLKKFVQANTRIVKRFKQIAFRSIRNRLVLSVFHIGSYAVVIVIMGHAAIQQPTKLATLYIALNLFGLMGEALNGISGSITRVWADMQILSYIHRLMRLTPERKTGKHLPRTKLVIEFQDVSFHYPGNKKAALTHLNLTIHEGEHLAIVGENGAGKSTFLRLLSGLDQPTSGQILLNGFPLKDYIPSEWRRAFHLMLQDSVLYQDFVKDNLYYGTTKRSEDVSYRNALYISGSDTVIPTLPDKERTFLGDWAAPPNVTMHQVSGGQEQRLLIARTLIHGGRIIGFDEPTSAMDANAEMRFFERMLKASGKRGLIFISHRFSTVRRAERIIVFDEGQLIEQGTHEDLLNSDGKYAELYRHQAQWYV